MEELIQAEFLIGGFVQGVGYRYYVWRQATALRLNGYTKNLNNGHVVVVVEGSKEHIEELHRLLKQGPSRSDVEYIKVIYNEFSGEFEGFDIL